ncbi:glucuronate isomerase (plasmid) [Enterococcus sp. 22-H-5-01]|uniref:glucuronate isomerase n=1 Tax=Enterococcus sp. 22-H-5-01 TaxID=3418555 RepID=UPI003D074046
MFLDQDFLLTTDVAKKLFNDYAKEMPIIDYHCHLNPKEIYEDKNFNNITEAWLTEGNNFGDHYKWRLMRANGVPEELITGNGDPYEKFLAFAGVLEKAYGNPIFEWCHLELRRFFDIETVLTTETAPEIWEQANQKLAASAFSRKSLIRNMKVKALSTTDDPIDDLHYHELLKAQEKENGFKVIPGFRPDKALNIHKNEFSDYMDRLSEVSGVKIEHFKDVVSALEKRVEYFEKYGCTICDHALDSVDYQEATIEELDEILVKALQKETLNSKEVAQYRSALLVALIKVYADHEWTMQYHMHALRNLNATTFDMMGPDTGYDAINDEAVAVSLGRLLEAGYKEGELPKTIIYSLNQNDWMQLLTVMACFQGGMKQKIQFGTAWWFNDTRTGMRNQLQMLMEQSLLGNFIGMLTDSRSFLSYPRHEYFRRVLCELLGEMVERGQIPNDEERLGKMVQDISFNNADEYFGFLK